MSGHIRALNVFLKDGDPRMHLSFKADRDVLSDLRALVKELSNSASDDRTWRSMNDHIDISLEITGDTITFRERAHTPGQAYLRTLPALLAQLTIIEGSSVADRVQALECLIDNSAIVQKRIQGAAAATLSNPKP